MPFSKGYLCGFNTVKPIQDLSQKTLRKPGLQFLFELDK